MIRFFLVFSLILFTSEVFGQRNDEIDGFVLQGHLSNCPERYFLFSFGDEIGKPYNDTIHIDHQGRFYYKTDKIKRPEQAKLVGKALQLHNLLVAPGYHLIVTGDAKNQSILHRTKRIDGVGSQSNRFMIMFDSIMSTSYVTLDWLSLNEAEFVGYSKRTRTLKDSLANVIFNDPAPGDRHQSFFGNMIRLDNLFSQLTMLLTYLSWNSYDREKATSFLGEHFDKNIVDNLMKDEYLVSRAYTNLISNQWLFFNIFLDHQKDSSLRYDLDYKLRKINESYKGKVREYALYRVLAFDLWYIKSFEELSKAQVHIEAVAASLSDKSKVEELKHKFKTKKSQLLQMQVGKPAPGFSLRGYDNRLYTMEDFKGKVVYLDFWASWCVPCREEIPEMKLLFQKYKNDARIAFVSIAIHDDPDKWKSAVASDKPEWLQLFDDSGVVYKLYFINSVPQFIIVDKNGNISNFDAPWPSSGQGIIELLNREVRR